MSATFKRVISNPEEVGNLSKKMSTGEEESSAKYLAHREEQQDSKLEATASPSAAAAVIESDEDPEPATTKANEKDSSSSILEKFKRQFGTSSSTSSSLSDKSMDKSGADKDQAGREAQVPIVDRPPGLRRNEGNLLRSDSRASTDSMASSGGPGGSGNWGWFEDVHGADGGTDKSTGKKKKRDDASPRNSMMSRVIDRVIDISQLENTDNEAAAAAMAVTAPTYVLEESLSSQKLWKHTAGNRPPQPEEERAYFEQVWAQNFAMSRVDYKVPVEVLMAGTPIPMSNFGGDHRFHEGGHSYGGLSNYNLATDSRATDAEVAEAIERLHGHRTVTKGIESDRHEKLNKTVQSGNEVLTVLIRGDNVFGTTVSKSFEVMGPNGTREVDTVNISIASYRVVESKKHGKYAQFLVIYREGSIRDTIGVWKRYSDFEALSQMVTQSHDSCSSVLANMSPLAVTQEPDVEHLPNAITSWRLLKKRQRWFRCLDAGYLSLKVFLLERFLHDILFESSSPTLLREFVIYDTSTPKSNA